MSGRKSLLVLIAAFALIYPTAGCLRDNEPPPIENAILISIDTLRADHLSCYGYGERTTPEIDKLAARGVLFENAISQSSWTLPAHASLFTGLYGSSHGAMHARALIREDAPMLTEFLERSGLSTAAFVTHILVGKRYGFDRGFQEFWMKEDARAHMPTQAAMEWIEENQGGGFFVFIHYFDPHIPYTPPEKYQDKYDEFCRREIGDFHTLKKAVDPTNPQREQALACILRRYDDEIRYVDQNIGDLVRFLSRKKLLDKTLIAITSDHGEEFLDHGGVQHGLTLYQEQIHAPLILCGAGLLPSGKRIEARVRTMDLMPTILETFGIPAPAGIQAASFWPHLRGEKTGDRDAISETSRVGPDRMALLSGAHKYIYSPKYNVMLREMKQQLFDLKADPLEKNDLLPGRSDIADRMRSALEMQQPYAWRKCWNLRWGGTGTGDVVSGVLTTNGRFIYAYKYLNLFDVDHSRRVTSMDYRITKTPDRIEFQADDQDRENGLVVVTEPDDAQVTFSLNRIAGTGKGKRRTLADIQWTGEISATLEGEVPRDDPKLLGESDFRVFTESILTYRDVPQLQESNDKNTLPPDMVEKLRALGYF